MFLLVPSMALRTDLGVNGTAESGSTACGVFSNCCATPKCSGKKHFKVSAGVYVAYENCRVTQPTGPWRTSSGKIITPETRLCKKPFGLSNYHHEHSQMPWRCPLRFPEAMTSFNRGYFTKLDKGDYICREKCDVYKEDADGQRSFYPEVEDSTVYRAGDVPETRQAFNNRPSNLWKGWIRCSFISCTSMRGYL